MTGYEKLDSLYAKMARKQHLQAVLDALEEEHGNLVIQVARLNTRWVKEENDVQDIENGLGGLMWTVLGKKDEKLDKERREACAAKVRYDSAVTQMETLEKSIKIYSDEMAAIEGDRQQYLELAQQEVAAIKAGRPLTEQDRSFLKGYLETLYAENKEIQQAIDEGEQAVYITDEVLKYLDKAEDMCTVDFFLDSMLVDMVKHENLDKAQDAIYSLQARLRKFRSEMVDVNISADVQVNLDEFTRWADIFWDNWFTDWEVSDQVTQSIAHMRKVRGRVENAVKDLLILKSNNEREQAEIQSIIANIR
ncbi:MAG: hypothetical protein IJ410_09525 [Oscillospiraceae bacterium]|nr:hypothetical protein [Oscillospiraceae bacterium]